MSNFNRSVNKGKVAEELFLSILKGWGYTDNDIEDVRYDEAAQKEDYDFIVRSGSDSIKIEVKADDRISETRNLFCESHSISLKTHNLNSGWMIYTTADYIYYYDTVKEQYYIIYTAHLQEYIANNNIKTISFNEYDEKTNAPIKKTFGMLVNIDAFMKAYQVDVLKKDGTYIEAAVAQRA